MRFLLSSSFSWLVKHFVDPGVYIVLHNTDLHLVKSDDDLYILMYNLLLVYYTTLGLCF